MILEVVKFGHPVLRKKGERIQTITPVIKKLIGDMFETMYAHKGVGLAAQQVGEALQLTVIDVRGATDRPSSLELDGKPAEVADFMPLVLINPELEPVGEPIAGGEGCGAPTRQGRNAVGDDRGSAAGAGPCATPSETHSETDQAIRSTM